MKHKKNIRKQSDEVSDGKEDNDEDNDHRDINEDIDDGDGIAVAASGLSAMLDTTCPTQGRHFVNRFKLRRNSEKLEGNGPIDERATVVEVSVANFNFIFEISNLNYPGIYVHVASNSLLGGI